MNRQKLSARRHKYQLFPSRIENNDTLTTTDSKRKPSEQRPTGGTPKGHRPIPKRKPVNHEKINKTTKLT